MSEYPGWIQVLFSRGSAHHALKTAFLVNSTRTCIENEVDAHHNGRELLRAVALEELSSDNIDNVAYSLVCLSVVGRPADLVNVEPYVTHTSDLVCRAAKSCRFALKQLSRTARPPNDRPPAA